MRELQRKTWIREKEAEAFTSVQAVEAELLARRQLVDDEEIARFFTPSMADLHDPFAFEEMRLAVELVGQAIKEQREILIYGDYDADGITATALLMRFFTAMGVPVRHMIPDRLQDGYSLGEGTLARLLADPPGLVITVDCGSSSKDEVATLMEAGIELMITDHHEVPDDPPRPLAFLNPHRPGEAYPNTALAGVGVAFKLLQGMVESFGLKDFDWGPYLVLAALGTVADSMPLLGENRSLVALGLAAFAEAAPLGLKLLYQRLGQGRPVTERFLAYSLAPRLNAAGRMGELAPALALLMAETLEAAEKAADRLEALNEARREEERRMSDEADAMLLAEQGSKHEDVVILAKEDWHIGVIGIVSARLSQRLQRPVICLGLQAGSWRGSARSNGHFDILAALRSAAAHAVAFGGHKMAAGVEVEDAALAAFMEAVRAHARADRAMAQKAVAVAIDMDLAPSAVVEELAQTVQRFAPFGPQNREPVFAFREMHLVSLRVVGHDGRHLKLELRMQDGRLIDAIAFGFGAHAKALRLGDLVDVAGHLQWHVWNGRGNLQIQVEDLQTTGLESLQTYWEREEAWQAGAPYPKLAKDSETALHLDPRWIKDVYPLLEASLSEGEILVDPVLFTHYLAAQTKLPLSSFAMARLFDILSEAKLLERKRSPEMLLALASQAPGEQRPVMSAQATWQRLQKEGGLTDVPSH